MSEDEPNAYSRWTGTCLNIEYVKAKNVYFFIHSLRSAVATHPAIHRGWTNVKRAGWVWQLDEGYVTG